MNSIHSECLCAFRDVGSSRVDAGAGSGRVRDSYVCRKCKEHGTLVPSKRHKRACPWRDCHCSPCTCEAHAHPPTQLSRVVCTSTHTCTRTSAHAGWWTLGAESSRDRSPSTATSYSTCSTAACARAAKVLVPTLLDSVVS